jgi:SAM-dependent methyltransferase
MQWQGQKAISGFSRSRDRGKLGSVTDPDETRPGPETILPVYEREAAGWARGRVQDLWEAPALEATVAGRAPGLSVLDLGCGAGMPIAGWYLARGDRVTGVDGAAAMVAEARRAVPAMEALHADMRGLDLRRRFDVILGFNSVFHLSPDDQRAMFQVFERHAARGARLLLTTGPAASETWGRVGASLVYHASLDPAEYRAQFGDHGFDVLWFRPEDPEFRGHSVWLAEAR